MLVPLPRSQFQLLTPVTEDVSVIGFLSQRVSPITIKEAMGFGLINGIVEKEVSLLQPAL